MWAEHQCNETNHSEFGEISRRWSGASCGPKDYRARKLKEIALKEQEEKKRQEEALAQQGNDTAPVPKGEAKVRVTIHTRQDLFFEDMQRLQRR